MTAADLAARESVHSPTDTCPYCGGPRDEHDRVTHMWERCARQVSLFASTVALTESARP